MRFKFQTKRHGRCFAEAEHEDDHIEVVIWFDENVSAKKVEYILHIEDKPLPRQIPEGGALQDAALIAINHFEAMKTRDGDQFEMHCGRKTARWRGTIYNKMGG
ncbi:hypothetical protein [Duganella callida]|uniref:Uncharacterized protein n=1 Tax=Duganella callida TaxID=2561932 RepID=A0A4Y9SB72_9BURK|nr:hypothetical protein [Duganella callida]TFW19447.1 hypothetical protein E4L98_16210 [Duganella callida]